MKYNPAIHNRKSIRLKGYDYSQTGLYLITICTQNKELLFGNIENGKMILNDAGKMIQTEWEKLPQRFSNIELHEFVGMPNHFHGILEIVDAVGAPLVGALDDVSPNDDVVPNESNPQTEPTIDNETITKNDGDSRNGIINRNNSGQSHDEIINRNDSGQSHNEIINHNNSGLSQSRATTRVAPTDKTVGNITDKTVGNMMAAFKSVTTVEYIRGVNNSDWQPFDGKLWQRNYHEHIIRDERAYQNISNYIVDNPVQWEDDKFYKK